MGWACEGGGDSGELGVGNSWLIFLDAMGTNQHSQKNRLKLSC